MGNTSDNQKPELIDFIYRDTNRIDSYAAQLLGGLLTSREKHSAEQTGLDKATSINTAITKHIESISSDTDKGARDYFSPHDTVATDVVNSLFTNGFVAKDPVNAPHGSVVTTLGTLMFTDRNMLEIVMKLMTAMFDSPGMQAAFENNTPEEAELARHVMQFSEHLQFPSAYILKGFQGHCFAGTIKENGLEESISSYYYKHGAGGLPKVHLLGIKEVSATPQATNSQSFIWQTQNMATAMHDMIFPQDAIVVTPIALFRKL